MGGCRTVVESFVVFGKTYNFAKINHCEFMGKSGKYVFLLVMLVAASSVWGRQRSMENVGNIAKGMLLKPSDAGGRRTLESVGSLRMVKSSEILPEIAQEAFYVCMPEGADKGYVIVSADDRMPDVLALSVETDFPEKEVPVNMLDVMQEYSDALKAIERGETTAREVFYPQDMDAGVTVSPLLGGILYNQGNPYNLLCPLLKTGKYAATGCVATAFAQIMRYYQWPADYGQGQKSYTSVTSTDTIKVDYDFSKTKFDWDNMLVSYAKKTVEYTAGEKRTENEAQNYLTYSTIFHYSGYTFRVDSLICHNSTSAFSGKVQMILTDGDGNFLQPVGDAKSISSLKKGYSYKTYNLTVSMPSSYPDGNYRLYVGTQYNNGGEWFYVKKTPSWSAWNNSSRHQENYISVTKRGTNFYIGDEEFCCEYGDENARAVAGLMAACGASVNMVYGSESSASTAQVPIAAAAYFGYDKDALYLSQTWFSLEDWHLLLQEELVAGHPVLMRGSSSSGGGHAFVFDGVKYVREVPYYHVNWGWGGSGNGYFLMTMLKPSEAGTGGSSTNYSNSNAMVVDLKPDDGVDRGCALGCKGLTVDDTTYVVPGGKFTATVTSVQNLGQASFSGKVNLCLIDGDGNQTTLGTCYSISGLKTGYFLTSSKTLSCTVPLSLPLGDYKLTVSGQSTDGKECRVFNAYVRTIHVVAEDPAEALPGVLRYTFDAKNNTAKVRRFSLSSAVCAEQYKGSVTVPDSVEYKGTRYEVTAIGDSAFYGCGKLTELVLSQHIKGIGKYAFSGTSALENITLPESVTSIGAYAFSQCGLKEVVIPASVTSMGDRVFYKSDALKTASLAEGGTFIGVNAFRECTALETVKLPSSLLRIPQYAFYGCSSLKSVTIPSSVTSIQGQAFKGCSALQAVYSFGGTPATLASKVFDDTNNCPIYVLPDNVEVYKTKWAAYASRIVADVTGIIGLPAAQEKGAEGIYDLNGVPVDARDVRRGHLYIIGGRKVLVR